MELILKEINSDNWEECIDLKVSDSQEDFVAPNWYSILEAQFVKELYPFCIYDGEQMIGFLMYDLDPDTDRMEMCRLMVDKKYQGKGYGRAAVLKLFDLIRNKYGNIRFYTSIEPNNSTAQKLYESLGFKMTGEIMWEELVMMVQL